MTAPFRGTTLTREVVLQTAAQWAQTPDVLLQVYQSGRETDTGREKTGNGSTLWANLPYDGDTLLLPYIDVTAAPYNAAGDGTTDDTAAIQAAVDAANTGLIKTVFFPNPISFYNCAGRLDFKSLKSVKLFGEGGGGHLGAGQETAQCALVFTGTGSVAFIDIARSRGLTIEGVDIQYSNDQFTGDLISSNDPTPGQAVTYNFQFLRGIMGGTTSYNTNRSCIYLPGSVRTKIQDASFYFSQYGILGPIAGSAVNWATEVSIDHNWFAWLSAAGVGNPEERWYVTNNTFEPLYGSEFAGGIKCGAYGGNPSIYGVNVSGNGFWDTVQGGAWIDFYGDGLNVHGNFFCLGGAGTGIKFRNASSGVSITGANIVIGGAGATFVDAGDFAVSRYFNDGTTSLASGAGVTLLANAGNLVRSSLTTE